MVRCGSSLGSSLGSAPACDVVRALYVTGGGPRATARPRSPSKATCRRRRRGAGKGPRVAEKPCL
jgi:hypothetical protein